MCWFCSFMFLQQRLSLLSPEADTLGRMVGKYNTSLVMGQVKRDTYSFYSTVCMFLWLSWFLSWNVLKGSNANNRAYRLASWWWIDVSIFAILSGKVGNAISLDNRVLTLKTTVYGQGENSINLFIYKYSIGICLT